MKKATENAENTLRNYKNIVQEMCYTVLSTDFIQANDEGNES